MEFLFAYSTQYLTHSKRNSLSPHAYVLFSMYRMLIPKTLTRICNLYLTT